MASDSVPNGLGTPDTRVARKGGALQLLPLREELYNASGHMSVWAVDTWCACLCLDPM